MGEPANDGSYDAYMERIERVCDPNQRRVDATRAEPSPKYIAGQAQTFPGITLLTPPDLACSSRTHCYGHLANCQTRICRRFPQHLIPTNSASFHITGADLFAGPKYSDIKSSRPQLDHSIAGILNGLKWEAGASAMGEQTWHFHGLAVFKHALVALFTPANRKLYEDLCSLRRLIYGSPELTTLGLRRPLPLMVHLTLAYFRSPINGADLEPFCAQLDDESNLLMAASIEHPIPTLALTRFEKMGEFFQSDAHAQFQLVP
ncbi:MAG: hypothetical protein VYA30_01820 [Myxococcota bacterium]|nr:hypothetical protein [Myxococcota bacterium]